MIALDMKIGKPNGKNQTFWRTIGTVFVSDDTPVRNSNGKPFTFIIDYPAINGIIVPRDKKEDAR